MEEMFLAEQQTSMPTDKALISVYVPQQIKEKLEGWAKEEDRSVSYIVGRLIAEEIELRESKKKKTPSSTTGKGVNNA